ncbi:VWA domain-containing protein [Alsobacter sp. SYSU M60028]|uniref:VWA domain-containing protein n=1 Tax=Alsobacter ponti TaxID=2962936 RepID=A0ABT1LIY3_9HYPH|nr:VWA domain-containing protein [Alsobacter ponti]MCP8940853.1 VWA domain-containing protein [Alsobacter ponti]
MLDFLELEETVGKVWHRLVGGAATYARCPEAEATLEEVRGPLAVMFRGFGGEAAVQIAAAGARRSKHRLGWRQFVGVGEERLEQPGRDGATLFLPAGIAYFPDPALNRALYRWLAAWFAVVPVTPLGEDEPLRRDLLALRRARRTTLAVLAAFPGLAGDHRALACAIAAARPKRPMPANERELERIVMTLLGAGDPPPGALWAAVAGEGPLPSGIARGYQPFLPCPLWGDAWLRAEQTAADDPDEAGGASDSQAAETRKRTANREREDAERAERDPLALNRFEKILAMAEMVDVDRPSDEDEDDQAREAADALEELTVGRRDGKPASRLKFDLDLPPEAVDRERLTAELTYPEWDYTRAAYLPAHCRVLAGVAPETGETWTPDAEALRHVRRVRRQFEALRPRRVLMRAQADGEELDLDALVRARCDLATGHGALDRVHMTTREQGQDLAVTLLVDVSLSTDSWVDGRRVLDVEKEALLVLAHGLAGSGDSHSILTFTSRRRSWVRVETVKQFGEAMSGAVERRIGALRPGYYTRIGAAIRHAVAQIVLQPNRRKLLIVLTDGKPNDVDHYEGRFGIEDTRRAVQEARRAGVAVFGVTIDEDAKSYFPTLFGRFGFATVGRASRLPMALPAIYRQLVG